VKEYKRYRYKTEEQITILYEFDNEAEMYASGLLHDLRRTTCFMSGGKYYVGGHFETKEHLRMKKVFICSRYRADEKHTTEDNINRALHACAYAVMKGYAPYAPHLYLPRCLDDNDPADRELGMAAGREFLAVCDEVWQWGATVSEGMASELALAAKLGIPVKVFNSIGIKEAGEIL
jgi:hypothetical protein